MATMRPWLSNVSGLGWRRARPVLTACAITRRPHQVAPHTERRGITTLPPGPPEALSAAPLAAAAAPLLLFGGGGALDGVVQSALLVGASELGDKTFFLSAIIAMREGRSVAFAGDAHTQKRTHTITDPQKGVAHGRDPVSTGTPLASP